jgi:hypothetical protein
MMQVDLGLNSFVAIDDSGIFRESVNSMRKYVFGSSRFTLPSA